VIHEVEQGIVRPMQVVEDEDERSFLGQRLQEPPPGGEGLAASVAGAEIIGIDADQRPQMPFEPRGPRRVRDDRRDGAVDLARRPRVAVRIDHARERSDDLTERPERGSLAVRQGTTLQPAPTAMAVEPTGELRHQPRLADPGDRRG
jgi:hypothetical protein